MDSSSPYPFGQRFVAVDCVVDVDVVETVYVERDGCSIIMPEDSAWRIRSMSLVTLRIMNDIERGERSGDAYGIEWQAR